MIDQIISTLGDFMSSLSPAIIYNYRVIIVLLCALNALLLLFLLFRTPASLRRRDRFFLSALADIVADRFAEDTGKALTKALNSRFPIEEETDPRDKIRDEWRDPVTGITLHIYEERGYWRADISGIDYNGIYHDHTVLRYMDSETFDKNLYMGNGKKYWTFAYDGLLDTIFIPELGMTMRRKSTFPERTLRSDITGMVAHIMQDVTMEPETDQPQKAEATLEGLSETPFKETVNEPEK